MTRTDVSEPPCEFCEIVRGHAPARIVGETADTLAFFPLRPAALGHTLVIPRLHVPDIWSLKPDLAARLTTATLKVCSAVTAALRPEGLNVIHSSGAAASQTVMHLHVHVVPRWKDDRIGNIWPPTEPLLEEVADEVADRVRESWAGLES